MLPKLRFFLRHALRATARSLGVTSLSVLTIGVSLAVLATFAVVVGHLRRVASELGDEVALSAYLHPDAVDVGKRLSLEVSTWDEVAHSWVLTSSAALVDFRAQLGPDAVLLEGLPADILPPSVEVRLTKRRWSVAEVRRLARRLQQAPGVSDVRYGQEDIQRVSALLSVARGGAFVLGVALSFATIVIIYNTIRLTLYARRDEIEIMSLVGASATFVRAPFVLEGALQGVLGGGAAAGLIFALEEVLARGLQRGLTYAQGAGLHLELFPPPLALALVLAGAGLGLVGSLLAVGKFLRL